MVFFCNVKLYIVLLAKQHENLKLQFCDITSSDLIHIDGIHRTNPNECKPVNRF